MNIYTILFMAQSFVCVFACVYCYTLGVKHGRIVRNDGVPYAPNPVSAVKDAVHEVQERKEMEKQEAGLTDVMSVSRESMLKAIEEERRSGKKVGK